MSKIAPSPSFKLPPNIHVNVPQRQHGDTLEAAPGQLEVTSRGKHDPSSISIQPLVYLSPGSRFGHLVPYEVQHLSSLPSDPVCASFTTFPSEPEFVPILAHQDELDFEETFR